MDKFTKGILTVIAVCLVVIVLKGSVGTPAYAESSFRHIKNQEDFRDNVMAALMELKSICR